MRQQGAELQLYVSDDGSTDETLARIEAFQRRTGFPVTLLDGPASGFAENFRSLINRVPDDFDHVCFCDQDDVWFDDKIARSIAALAALPAGQAALYCSRTLMISESGRPGGMSPAFGRRPGFGNALVQSLAGGNTITGTQSITGTVNVRAGNVLALYESTNTNNFRWFVNSSKPAYPAVQQRHRADGQQRRFGTGPRRHKCRDYRNTIGGQRQQDGGLFWRHNAQRWRIYCR
ncbi:MAG: glycosyltransferase [Phyllobacteriaceae bacterium]|nr:glycosyltransferase [Phyllobacteriaceae bacterium]